MSAPAAPPSRRKLAFATLVALAVAFVVHVLVVLPAEFGIDPTGVGAATGLDRLYEPPDTHTDVPEPSPHVPTTTIRTYVSSFPVTAHRVHESAGYLNEGDTILVPFPVQLENLSKVTLRIEFADRNTTPNGQTTRPDTFEIELKAPHGDVTGGVLARSEATSGGGRGAAVYEVRRPPFPREIEAASLDAARAAFEANDPPDTTLAGQWQARVTMVDAGDADAQGVPLGAGPVADAGNDWRIVVTVETYALAVDVKPGTEQRSDSVRLSLPASAEMEYKLRMGLGGRVEWSWYTDGPTIYVDFHGEKSGDPSGAFTRHKNGDFKADFGTLVAPFDGSHGWFWRNTSPLPVTITLDTRGQYDVIGRV